MKVSVITPEFPPMQGGVGDYSSHLVRALQGLGLDITVITSAAARRSANDLDITCVSDWGFGSWRAIVEHIRTRRPDVLHIQYQTAGYGMQIAINLLPLRLRLLAQRPRIVTTFHDLKVPYVFPKAGRLRHAPGALLAGFSDAVILTNYEDVARLGQAAGTGARMQTRFRGRPIHVIPIGSNIPNRPPAGYDRQNWRSRFGIGPDEAVLCYFGFLNSTKGIETLLSAFETLLARGRWVKLLMVGGPFGDSDKTNLAYGRSIMDRIERSGYKEFVIWTGFLGDEEVSASLLAADICVLPFDEGASFRHGTLIAAISHGLAIVTTTAVCNEIEIAANSAGAASERRGGSRTAPTRSQLGNAIENRFSCAGKSAQLSAELSAEQKADESYANWARLPSLEGKAALVPPKQPDELASAIERLLSSETERARLRRNASEIAASFAWDAIANDTLAAYVSLLAA